LDSVRLEEREREEEMGSGVPVEAEGRQADNAREASREIDGAGKSLDYSLLPMFLFLLVLACLVAVFFLFLLPIFPIIYFFTLSYLVR